MYLKSDLEELWRSDKKNEKLKSSIGEPENVTFDMCVCVLYFILFFREKLAFNPVGFLPGFLHFAPKAGGSR